MTLCFWSMPAHMLLGGLPVTAYASCISIFAAEAE